MHYEMFIEVWPNSIKYDLVQFGNPQHDEYDQHFGVEIMMVSDGPKTWEHAVEDINVFQPKVIKVNVRYNGQPDKVSNDWFLDRIKH